MKRLIVLITAIALFAPNLAVAHEIEEDHSHEAAANPAAEAEAGDDLAQVEDVASDEGDDEVVLEDEVAEEEGGSLIAPFSVNLSISNTVSLGTLFRDKYSVTNYDVLSFGFGVGYATPVDGLNLSLSAGYSKYLSEAGGSVQQREGRWSDMGLGASYGLWSDPDFTGLSLSSSLGFTIPTSEMSRFTNLRTAVRMGLGLSRSFGDLSLSYGISFKKNWHRDTSVVADLDQYDLDVLARDGGLEQLSETQVALDTGVLSSFSLSNSFSVSYGWFEGFRTSISFSFSDSWTYDNGTITANDEFTSENAVVGRGHGQSMSGSISASYAFLDYFSAGISMSTSQQPLTADNQRVRFPFFDLETGNLSATSLSVSLSAAY